MQSEDQNLLFSKAALIASNVLGSKSRVLEDRSQCSLDQEISDIWISHNPFIPIEDYIELIFLNTEIEESTLVIAIILFERFITNSKLKLSWKASYHIILTSIIVAIKLNEDSVYDFRSFSMMVQVPYETISQLESEFLATIDWKIHVNLETYRLYCASLYN